MNVWTFAGGPVFWLLAAMGVAATVIFLVRLLGLRRAHIDYVDFIHGVGNLEIVLFYLVKREFIIKKVKMEGSLL